MCTSYCFPLCRFRSSNSDTDVFWGLGVGQRLVAIFEAYVESNSWLRIHKHWLRFITQEFLFNSSSLNRTFQFCNQRKIESGLKPTGWFCFLLKRDFFQTNRPHDDGRAPLGVGDLLHADLCPARNTHERLPNGGRYVPTTRARQQHRRHLTYTELSRPSLHRLVHGALQQLRPHAESVRVSFGQ